MPGNPLAYAGALAGAPPFPSLATDRLVLREFEPDDREAVFRIFSNEAVTAWHNIARVGMLEDARQLVAWRAEQWPSGRGVRWAIALREHPLDAIGSCGFDFQRRRHGAVELSYDLDPAHWDRGFAREALAGAIGCAFAGRLGLAVGRIEALTQPGNRRSTRLLGALGFHQEGVLRRYRHWHGEAVDLACWSLLRGD